MGPRALAGGSSVVDAWPKVSGKKGKMETSGLNKLAFSTSLGRVDSG